MCELLFKPYKRICSCAETLPSGTWGKKGGPNNCSVHQKGKEIQRFYSKITILNVS